MEHTIPEDFGPKASQYALTLNNFGAKAREDQKFLSAEIAFRKCVAMHPDVPVFWSNLGASLLDQSKFPEVLEVLSKAIDLEPSNARAIGNLALAMANHGNFTGAMELFDRALNLIPGDRTIRWNQVCMSLSEGLWNLYQEYVYLRPKALGNDYFDKTPFKYWDGKQDLNGKKLFVQFDQGLGDRILHSRFVYHLKQRYPDVDIIALTYERMNSLFWGFQEEKIMTLIPEKIPFPKADYGVYVDDLLGLFNVTPENIPQDPGIIRKYTEKVADKLSESFPFPLIPALKVGICWTGNVGMPRNKERSIPLESLLTLAEIPSVALYSLQAGPGSADIERLGAQGLIHHTGGFGAELEKAGISYAAAVIMNLDLVITCCTSIAHLAGSLGVPTWLILCRDPYWIWLREGNTTNWYPSMTIFRQPEPKDWTTPINDVKHLLKQTAAELVGEKIS